MPPRLRVAREHVKSRERNKAESQAQKRFAQLPERKREVLDLIVVFLTNKEIGSALGVPPRTVEMYPAELGAESLAQLIQQYAGLADGQL